MRFNYFSILFLMCLTLPNLSYADASDTASCPSYYHTQGKAKLERYMADAQSFAQPSFKFSDEEDNHPLCGLEICNMSTNANKIAVKQYHMFALAAKIFELKLDMSDTKEKIHTLALELNEHWEHEAYWSMDRKIYSYLIELEARIELNLLGHQYDDYLARLKRLNDNATANDRITFLLVEAAQNLLTSCPSLEDPKSTVWNPLYLDSFYVLNPLYKEISERVKLEINKLKSKR